MKQYIHVMASYFNFLNSDYINLDILYKNSITCIKNCHKIEHKIKKIFNINPFDKRTIFIAELFLNYFDNFNQRRPWKFIKHSKYFKAK